MTFTVGVLLVAALGLMSVSSTELLGTRDGRRLDGRDPMKVLAGLEKPVSDMSP